MLQLTPKDLPAQTQAQLRALQDKIDQIAGFPDKVSKAQRLWDNRNPAAAFEVTKNTLKSMCVSVETCNYCEHNEASDIEHIFPKSFFPSRTFQWENLLLACKKCNSELKKDRFAILNDADEVIYLERGTQPANDRAAFINPRVENPSDFIVYNAQTHEFSVIPDHNTIDGKRSLVTLEILGLNNRDELRHARKNAYHNFYNDLERLVRQLSADSWETLEALLYPYDERFDRNMPLEAVKDELKTALQAYIQKSPHPSVWYAIKLLGRQDPKWARLFEAVPEALTW